MSFSATIDRLFYPEYSEGWDNALFRERIQAGLTSDAMILDLGAGSGRVPQMNFRGLCRQVCGLDPEESVLENRYLDLAKVGTAESVPWPDATFDLVFSANVLEHLHKPREVFNEVLRVLKPGGTFLVKTPNRFHYVAVLSTLLPLRIHVAVNNWRGRAESDTFPTYYRANSKRVLEELGRGFGSVSVEPIEGRPEYARQGLLAVLYPFALLWERAVNRFEFLSCFRVILIARFVK